MFFAVVTGRRRIKKPTTVCQPWVLVETQFTIDKRQRRRQLRRRPAEPLVEYFLTLAQSSGLPAKRQAFMCAAFMCAASMCAGVQGGARVHLPPDRETSS